MKTGTWIASLNPAAAVVGNGCVHDGNSNKGASTITFSPDLPAAGTYDIILHFPPNPNRATQVPVTVTIQDGGSKTIRVNQRDEATQGVVSLGTWWLPKGRLTSVTISNRDTEGYVVVDGVQFLPERKTDPSGPIPAPGAKR